VVAFVLFGGLGMVLGAVAGTLFPRRIALVVAVGIVAAATYLAIALATGCEPRCESWKPLTTLAAVANGLGWAVAATIAALVRRSRRPAA
jgi:hypothetical protein